MVNNCDGCSRLKDKDISIACTIYKELDIACPCKLCIVKSMCQTVCMEKVDHSITTVKESPTVYSKMYLDSMELYKEYLNKLRDIKNGK